MHEKASLRKRIRERYANCTREELEMEARMLVERLEAHPQFEEAKVVLTFSPLPDEINITPLIDSHYKSKTWLLPVVNENSLLLKQYDGTKNLTLGAYNILEPLGVCYEDFERIDLIIVPGVAFSWDAQRLGRGKGYYDRLLSGSRLMNAYKLGVGFDFQIIKAIPINSHDIAMNEVISPSYNYYR